MVNLAVLDAGERVVQPPVHRRVMGIRRYEDLLALVRDTLDRADDGGRSGTEHLQQLFGLKRRGEILINLSTESCRNVMI